MSMIRLLIVFLILFPTYLSAATYYIDYGAADDSGTGTSTGTAWKRAPGMAGCAANCAAYSHSNGDVFVFKGGVTWPYVSGNAVLQIANSGADGTEDIYTGGNNPAYNWGTGYPIFDGGNTDAQIYGVYSTAKSHIKIRYIKIQNFSATAGNGMGIVISSGSNVEIDNNYISPNGVNCIGWGTSTGTYSKIYIHDNTLRQCGRVHIDASDASVSDVKYYNNTMEGGWDYSPSGAYHTDGLMIGGGTGVGVNAGYSITNLYVYNNKFWGDWQLGATAMLYLNGTPMGCTDYTGGSHEPTPGTVSTYKIDVGTSTDEITIGTGAKTFTVGTGLAFVAGQTIHANVTADLAKYMVGTVTSYNSGTGSIVIEVYDSYGTGTYSAWKLMAGIGTQVYYSTNTGGWGGAGTGKICGSARSMSSGQQLIEGEFIWNGNLVATTSSAVWWEQRKSIQNAYIYNNLFTVSNTTTSTDTYAIYVSYGHDNIFITNNTIDFSTPTTPVGHGIIYYDGISNMTVKNNIIVGSAAGVAYSVQPLDSVTGTHVIDNNIMYLRGAGRSILDMGTPGADLRTCAEMQGAGWQTTYCSVADPLFTTNPTGADHGGGSYGINNGNWMIQSGSPAKDNGQTLTYNTDYSGTSRPQGAAWDIGAYEYGGTIPGTISLEAGGTLSIGAGGTITFQ